VFSGFSRPDIFLPAEEGGEAIAARPSLMVMGLEKLVRVQPIRLADS